MRYYKTIENGYTISIGTGNGGTEITETEYTEILAVIRNKPTSQDGYDYRLKTDLTWEEYAIPPMPEEDELTVEDKAEAYDILIGGAS